MGVDLKGSRENFVKMRDITRTVIQIEVMQLERNADATREKRGITDQVRGHMK